MPSFGEFDPSKYNIFGTMYNLHNVKSLNIPKFMVILSCITDSCYTIMRLGNMSRNAYFLESLSHVILYKLCL